MTSSVLRLMASPVCDATGFAWSTVNGPQAATIVPISAAAAIVWTLCSFISSSLGHVRVVEIRKRGLDGRMVAVLAHALVQVSSIGAGVAGRDDAPEAAEGAVHRVEFGVDDVLGQVAAVREAERRGVHVVAELVRKRRPLGGTVERVHASQ